MKKFEYIRNIFLFIIQNGYNDYKQDSISEYTKDKFENTVYVKKIDLNIGNIESIAITSLSSDFNDSCDSDVRIAFKDTNISKRIILYANEVETSILETIYNYLNERFVLSKDKYHYKQIIDQLNYLDFNNVNVNLPRKSLDYILHKFKTSFLTDFL